MKRLVILGEGHGEVTALPVLARKVLKEKDPDQRLFVDEEIIRTHNPLGLVKWNKQQNRADYEQWLRYIKIAARRRDVGGILAVFDGDAENSPRARIPGFAQPRLQNQWRQKPPKSVQAKHFPLLSCLRASNTKAG
jgi:hypothetical protein